MGIRIKNLEQANSVSKSDFLPSDQTDGSTRKISVKQVTDISDAYTDSEVAKAKAYTDTEVAEAVSKSKAYTDSEVAKVKSQLDAANYILSGTGAVRSPVSLGIETGTVVSIPLGAVTASPPPVWIPGKTLLFDDAGTCGVYTGGEGGPDKGIDPLPVLVKSLSYTFGTFVVDGGGAVAINPAVIDGGNAGTVYSALADGGNAHGDFQ